MVEVALRGAMKQTVTVVETRTDDAHCDRFGSIKCETWTDVAQCADMKVVTTVPVRHTSDLKRVRRLSAEQYPGAQPPLCQMLSYFKKFFQNRLICNTVMVKRPNASKSHCYTML